MATIHVELLDEGVECWRPVEAERLNDGTYRITDSCPDGETWAFARGDVVRCRQQSTARDSDGVLLGPTILVAYERVS